MQYEKINIYKKDKFELYSLLRDRSFRYIRYTGHNYNEIIEYIRGASPNTTIWPEEQLSVGVLYTYSGRTFQFHSIPEYAVRFCLINNPYIIEDGCEPLFMSREEAGNYLMQDSSHRIFCYEDAIKTFYYANNSFVVTCREHPKGITIKELPIDYKEWYIGSNDGLERLTFDYSIKYEKISHTIHLSEDFSKKVDTIYRLIYEINKLQYSKSNPVIFTPSWEDYQRQKTLEKPCDNYRELQEFVKIVYIILFEQTKQSGKTLATIPEELRNEGFLPYIREFRHLGSHGNSEYKSFTNLKPSDIYLYFAGNDVQPNEHDVETIIRIQDKILDLFISYLEIVHNKTSTHIFEGFISVDDEDNVYCKRVLLPKDYYRWRGCKCRIVNITKNSIYQLKENYPYYCNKPFFIDCELSGVIEIKEGNCYCDDVLLPPCYEEFVGERILIKRITKKSISWVALKSQMTLSSPIVGRVRFIDGNLYVNDIVLPHKYSSYQDCDVSITELLPIYNKDEGSYSWMASHIVVVEGLIEYDSVNNLYYCKNIIIPGTNLGIGYRIRINNVVKNLKEGVPYNYFCTDYNIINR